ncbi:DNA-binding transcriptional regulator, LacI/PurR family [Arthrobacter sp. 31Cvi3.1E]|nr:DNA-binding transcriptional regulator, LacI/PurR family [Arthrobacter sp. 31Cvi3.1E]
MGKPTIIDLAKHLGISKTTVADALKGSGRVAEETRAKVVAAAREIGYTPNRAARQLREHSTGAIALYIPQRVRNMSFYMPFALGVADRASENGYDLTLLSDGSVGTSSWAHVDGVILVDAVLDDPVVSYLGTASVPIVTAGRVAGFPQDRVSGTVDIDHERMCKKILDVMAERGAQRVALICPEPGDEYSWSNRIVAGYRDWCEGRGADTVLEIISSFPSNEELEAALDEALVRGGADSVLFAWQDVALRAEAMLNSKGLRVGDSVKVASLLSSPDNLHYPYLAGLDLRPYEFGQETAALLCESLSRPPAVTLYRAHLASILLP